MIESNLARVDTTLAELGEQIDAVNEKCIERIDRQVDAKHRDLEFRLAMIECRIVGLEEQIRILRAAQEPKP